MTKDQFELLKYEYRRTWYKYLPLYNASKEKHKKIIDLTKAITKIEDLLNTGSLDPIYRADIYRVLVLGSGVACYTLTIPLYVLLTSMSAFHTILMLLSGCTCAGLVGLVFGLFWNELPFIRNIMKKDIRKLLKKLEVILLYETDLIYEEVSTL